MPIGDILLNRYVHPFCNSCNWEKRELLAGEKEVLVKSFAQRVNFSLDSSVVKEDSDILAIETPRKSFWRRFIRR